MIKEIERLQRGENLSRDEMKAVMDNILNPGTSSDTIRSFLIALHEKGETVEEITGAIEALRARMIPANAPETTYDCCGTGGDGASTLNISTAVAFVAAACGLPMAKHGNRAATSKSGAADVLEALGGHLNNALNTAEQSLQEINFAFLMAPDHHPALKHIAPIRKTIPHRTLFNMTGPLLNPARANRQLIGVYDPSLMRPFADILNTIDTDKALIVHGSDGLDEITVTGETHALYLNNGQTTELTLSPEMFGFARYTLNDIRGGDASYNAKALRDMLSGADNAYRAAVAMNTAGVLFLHDDTKDWKVLLSIALNSIDSGKALDILNTYIEMTNA